MQSFLFVTGYQPEIFFKVFCSVLRQANLVKIKAFQEGHPKHLATWTSRSEKQSLFALKIQKASFCAFCLPVPPVRAQGQPVIHPWPGVSRAFLESCASQEPSYSLLTADCVSTMCSPAFWEQETYRPKQFPFSKSHPFYHLLAPNSETKEGQVFTPGLCTKQRGGSLAASWGTLPVLCFRAHSAAAAPWTAFPGRLHWTRAVNGLQVADGRLWATHAFKLG